MIIQFNLLFAVSIIAIICFACTLMLAFKKITPPLKIVLSGYIAILITLIGIIITSISDYNVSYYIDIMTIYFILGFANCVLYFVFFHRRT